MAIDFEEFLNKALSSNTQNDDIFEQDFDNEDESSEELEEISSISIQPLLEQISSLKEKAIETPERFKEIYQKFEEFEKNYPLYFIDIQSSLYDTQSTLKTQYLNEVLEKENNKILKIKEIFDKDLEIISDFISEKKFKQAHDKINYLNYEIIQVPNSFTNFKLEYNKKIGNLISTYYTEFNKYKKELTQMYLGAMKSILNQRNLIFSTINRVQLDELINNIQTLFLKKRIELDIYLSSYVPKFISFTDKLIEHRTNIQKKCEYEFKKYFDYLESQFNKSINAKKVHLSLVILEVTHLLLKKETIFNQELKISYFLKLIEFKKELNKLSYASRKGFSEEELVLCYIYSKLNLVNLIQNSIIRYTQSQILEIIEEISNTEGINPKYKNLVLLKLKSKVNITRK